MIFFIFHSDFSSMPITMYDRDLNHISRDGDLNFGLLALEIRLDTINLTQLYVLAV